MSELTMDSCDSPKESYCLVGLNDELKGKRFLLRHGLTFGRSACSDVFLPDPSVSRHHCRVELSSVGFELRNCEVRQDQDGNTTQPIRVGNELMIGRFRLRVEVAESGTWESPKLCPSRPERRRRFGSAERISLHTGPILAVKLSVPGDDARLLEMIEPLRKQLRNSIDRTESRLIEKDPSCWWIYWDEQTLSSQSRLHTGMSTAAILHELAFQVSKPDCRLGATVGIALGKFHTTIEGLWRSVPWGGTADVARNLALMGTPGATLLSEGEDTISLPLYTVPSDPAGYCCVKALAEEATGRRLKLLTWLSAVMSRNGYDQDIFIRRVSYDPETSLTTLSLLAKAPIENDEYLLSVTGGSSACFQCRSCQPVRNDGGIRTQLTAHLTSEDLTSLLGFDPFVLSIGSMKENQSSSTAAMAA